MILSVKIGKKIMILNIFENLKIDSAQKLEKIKKNPKNILVLSTIMSVS